MLRSQQKFQKTEKSDVPECREVLVAEIAQSPPTDEELLKSQDDRFVIEYLKELQCFDVIFLALHGGAGEDGTIQAALDLNGIPYTGTGHKSSAIAMDKDISKRLFIRNTIPTAPWLMAPVFRFAGGLQPWSMMEVFLIGIIVALVKLLGMAQIVPGVALWSFALLIVTLAAAAANMDSRVVWDRVEYPR